MPVSAWMKAMVLLFFAYGGFESATAPMSEAKNPGRDAAFALFVALIACTAIYALVQWVVVGVLGRGRLRIVRWPRWRASRWAIAERRWLQSARWFRCMAI